MSTHKPLRAGLIGLGSMGRNHARVLHGLEGVELVAGADPVAAPGSAPAGVPLVRSVAELAAAGIDYAVVACPTALHEEVALDLAERGIHALIEKPLAPSVRSAETIGRAFEKHGLVAAVGHIERFNPALRELRARLELGELGEFLQVVTRRQGPFPARIADVGVVYDLATHDIDLTAWLTNSRYESVTTSATIGSGGRSGVWGLRIRGGGGSRRGASGTDDNAGGGGPGHRDAADNRGRGRKFADRRAQRPSPRGHGGFQGVCRPGPSPVTWSTGCPRSRSGSPS
ncbi:Gfo/Idh/MocA family oxidoreductase [Streptomyces sp. NPDC001750]|uniref:Gfo/Idh/MocA family oxidoreductase n=1 Tax=Streptomyces sp. NPDC001750 TaxID=3364607 RepID=UPI0036CF4A54